jgi:hypothetical protein
MAGLELSILLPLLLESWESGNPIWKGNSSIIQMSGWKWPSKDQQIHYFRQNEQLQEWQKAGLYLSMDIRANSYRIF